MSDVGKKERETQKRLVRLFQEQLSYSYLGNWEDRGENSNVEEDLLRRWLKRHGESERIIGKVVYELEKAKALGGSKNLYDANREVYGLLRYGVKVAPDAGENKQTIWLIDWKTPINNDFAVAEEVTVGGVHDKRPDLVLYVNGIAVGVLELKRSIVSVAEGIRQNLDNQKKEFIRPFFATVQLVMAGNDTEGLRYGVIETAEKYYLTWKEPSEIENQLDRAVSQLCRKDRLLEIIHDFIVFDAGAKKTCRHNQYFGVRAAQESVKCREGGIIWHTQGSGKSLTMVWLAKWIRENVKDARVLLITDRIDLDDQIEKVFKGVNENIYRTKSGADLVNVLNKSEELLICSLVHKFGASDDPDVDSYLADIHRHVPKDFYAKGDIFVFVDECHRTHKGSGKLHQAMTTLLPGAMLIGFTGTPLLKAEKQKSIEVFGPYIHTYKYDEAVRDKVVLDLRYEARDIDQHITSQQKIDEWFDLKTSGLTDAARAQLKQRWGTMQKVLSSEPRLKMIVSDILMDMEREDRLKSGYGNAMLVSSSIYNACRFFEMFQKTDLARKCAIVTSYKPAPGDIKGEESGEGMTEKLRQYAIYREMLAEHFDEPEETAMYKVAEFEQEVKSRFIKEPGQMKLLIVVDKLLTGFDAPPATYLYIDKKMENHGLFQAICRVNRLDSEDKEYGYVIDYKDLFKSLERSIHDYTGEAFEGYDAEDVQGLLTDRLTKARERLEELRESVKALCEPVQAPKDSLAYQHYFCAKNSGDGDELEENEQKRVALYKIVGALLRAYANLANEMGQAGYTEEKAKAIKAEVEHFEKVREEIKLSSGDYIDMKMYEPAMRHLLDTYIRADESKKLSAFDDMTLVQLVAEQGEGAVKHMPEGLKANPEAMAEAIENNVRKLIIDERAVNPKYFERMSQLLEALIRERKTKALHYTAYLAKVAELANKVQKPESESSYPSAINTGPRRALYDNLGKDEELAVRVDTAIRDVKKDGWRGNRFKEREVRAAIKSVLGVNDELVNQTFAIVEKQREY
ncbi:MAG: type I restriction endonuclease subunit R [Acidobacteria bacterium]|nr:type I restriction endonuclease subunit R [Acidobacteriota bacterium]